METLRQELHLDDTKSPSPEMFSFPGTPTEEAEGDDSDFEFGSCVTPATPTTPHDPSKNSASPADQFFLNGRLLPHEFPVVPTSTRTSFSGRENAISSNNSSSMINLSRGTSVGSNTSIMSSRSNSTNSRGSITSTCSTCSSARTSSSVISEKRKLHKRMHMKGYCRTASVRDQRHVANSTSLAQYYHNGSSQRWQFITSAPVLGPSRSRRSRKDTSVGPTTSPKNNSNSNNNNNNNNHTSGGFLHRILRAFVATCKACHAMEGQENDHFDLDEGSVVGNRN